MYGFVCNLALSLGPLRAGARLLSPRLVVDLNGKTVPRVGSSTGRQGRGRAAARSLRTRIAGLGGVWGVCARVTLDEIDLASTRRHLVISLSSVTRYLCSAEVEAVVVDSLTYSDGIDGSDSNLVVVT